MSDPPPVAPFHRWPVQTGGRTVYGLAWYTRPAVFVTQSHLEHGTVASAMMTEAVLDRVLARYVKEVTTARGLLVIHDWRKVTTFDARVVPFYADRLTVRSKHSIRGIILCVQANVLARLAMQAVGAVVSRVHGIDMEVSDDLPATLTKHNVQRPEESVIVD